MRKMANTYIKLKNEIIDFDKKVTQKDINYITDFIQKYYSAKNIFEKISTIGTGYVISDLHANISSLRKILEITNFCEKIDNGEDISLIFLGDYIDKGKNNLTMLYTIFKLKECYPDNVILLRGNHETSYFLNRFMSFKKEIAKTFGPKKKEIYRIFNKTFDCLPVIAFSENGIIAMHGGPPTSLTLYGLTNIGMREILWSDVKKNPTKDKKFNSLWRLGKGRKISILEVEQFLDNLGMTFLFRGHSHTMKGVEATSKNIMTVISANSLDRFTQRIGNKSQAGFVEVDLSKNINHISQVKTIFLDSE